MEKENGIWMPNEIALNQDLSLEGKFLLVKIKNQDQTSDGCKSTNQDFANFLNVSTKTVQRTIKDLKELGLISVEYNEHNNERIIKFLKLK
jgi:DNA-binding MarR family transcriptional regulator